jgi:hypothetical protein
VRGSICQEALGCQETAVDDCLFEGSIGAVSEVGRHRSPTWSTDETVTLVHVWKQTETQKRQRDIGRNRPIWIEISKELEENRYSRTCEQCKTRSHNLKSHYKNIKDEYIRKQDEELLGPISRF